MMGAATHPVTGDLDAPETTFTSPDLTTFLGLDSLGLTAVGQHLTANRAVIEYRMPIGFEDPFCRSCGAQGVAHGYVTVIIDLTPVRDYSGPARLLDVVPGPVQEGPYKTWLSQRDQDWRGRVEVVATGRLHRVPRAPPTRSSHRRGR